MIASHSSSVMLWTMRSRRMPAGLAIACRPPKVSIACCTMRFTAARSVTLSVLAMASPPAALISSTTSCAGALSGALAVHVAAEVVYNHLGAVPGGDERRLAPNPAPAAGDQHNLPIEQSHRSRPLNGL